MSVQPASSQQIALGRELVYKLSKEQPQRVKEIGESFSERDRVFSLFTNGASPRGLTGFSGPLLETTGREFFVQKNSETDEAYQKRMNDGFLLFERNWLQILSDNLARLTDASQQKENGAAIHAFLAMKALPTKNQPLYNFAGLARLINKVKSGTMLSFDDKQKRIADKKKAKDDAIENKRRAAEAAKKAAEAQAAYEQSDEFKFKTLVDQLKVNVKEYQDLRKTESPNFRISEGDAKEMITDANRQTHSQSPYYHNLASFIRNKIDKEGQRGFDCQPEGIDLDMIQKPYTWGDLSSKMQSFVTGLSTFIKNRGRLNFLYDKIAHQQAEMQKYKPGRKYTPLEKPLLYPKAVETPKQEKAAESSPAPEVNDPQPPSKAEPSEQLNTSVHVRNAAVDSTKAKVGDAQPTAEVKPSQKSDSNVEDTSKTDSKKEQPQKAKENKTNETSGFWSFCSWLCSLPTRLFSAIKRLFA
jgi:hypothetical protein